MNTAHQIRLATSIITGSGVGSVANHSSCSGDSCSLNSVPSNVQMRLTPDWFEIKRLPSNIQTGSRPSRARNMQPVNSHTTVLSSDSVAETRNKSPSHKPVLIIGFDGVKNRPSKLHRSFSYPPIRLIDVTSLPRASVRLPDGIHASVSGCENGKGQGIDVFLWRPCDEIAPTSLRLMWQEIG